MRMKKILLVCLAMNFLFICCKKDRNAGTPECILQRIEAIKKQPIWNPPAEIHEYIYKGKTVYLISSNCCDQYNMLVDENCNNICAPSGGITGKGDGKCPDFQQNSTHIRLVWKDERAK